VRCQCATLVRVVRFRPTRRVPSPTRSVGIETGTPCAYHAGNAAAATCVRCGSFLCELCATPIAEATYCTACFERLNAEGRLISLGNHVPRPHMFALGAGIVSLFPLFGLLFAPFAIWQGVKAARTYGILSEREGSVWAYLVVAVLCVLGGVALSVLALRS
jgi:hypothetical protein